MAMSISSVFNVGSLVVELTANIINVPKIQQVIPSTSSFLIRSPRNIGAIKILLIYE